MATRFPSSRRPLRRLGVVAAVTSLLLSLVALAPAGADLTPSTRVGNSTNPTTASIDIAANVTSGTATRVLIGRNDVFADSIAGSAAAGTDGALLLVDPAPAGLSSTVRNEVRRLLGANTGTNCQTGLGAEVLLLGGEQALSAGLRDALAAEFCVDRLSGATRVETAIDVADAVLAAGSNRGTLLLARADNPADSAAAGAYAAATGTPLAVTFPDDLHPAVEALLDPAGGVWGRVVLLGGEAALPAAIEQAVRNAAGPGTTVTRVAGATRDGTALDIAEDLWGAMAGTNVAIVNGYSATFWTYALPGGVAASRNNSPLLYALPDGLPTSTNGYLQTNSPGVTTIGPVSEVSDATKATAEAGGTTGLGADLRVLALTPDSEGRVTVPTQAGDYSITLTARVADGQQVAWTGVQGPGYSLGFDQLDLYTGQTRDSALVVPFLPSQPALQPGSYVFTAEASSGALTGVRAVVKSGNPNARQVLDVNFYVVTDHVSVDEQSERNQLTTTYRQVGEQILGGQNLGVGNIRFVDTDQALRNQYQTLTLPAGDENRNIRGLCGALRTRSGESRALNFAIVDRLVDDPPQEGETLGISAGIPGSPVLTELTNSCVILPADASLALAQQGTTVWHEAGHFLGLFHSSEADGQNFDPLPDTPECGIAADANNDGQTDEFECGATADNFMFHNTDDTTMTAHQAFVLRRNPMFRPAA